MARGKSKPKTRRRKSLISAIDVGTSIVVANATTQAFFGTNVWNFFTDGWFGRSNAGSGNSWQLSLKELVNGAIGGENIGSGNAYGMSTSFAASSGVMGAIQKNLKDNGARSLVTIIAAPAVASVVKRLARKPIRDANKLMKATGISQATGVKM